MAAVSRHGHAIRALHRCHSLNHDTTGSAKYPLEKQTRSHWALETLCIDTYFLSVAIILCNKMDSVLVQTFAEPVTY